MNTNTKQKEIPPVVRQYDIGGVRYIVIATVKSGVTEDAKTKINRLIQNDIGREKTAE